MAVRKNREEMIRLLLILVLLQACVSTPIIVEEEPNDQPMEVSTEVLISTTGAPIGIVVKKSAVDIQEVMELKELNDYHLELKDGS